MIIQNSKRETFCEFFFLYFFKFLKVFLISKLKFDRIQKKYLKKYNRYISASLLSTTSP